MGLEPDLHDELVLMIRQKKRHLRRRQGQDLRHEVEINTATKESNREANGPSRGAHWDVGRKEG